MSNIFIFLLLGGIIGFVFRYHASFLEFASKASNITIFIMIFLMGLSIGLNKNIVLSLSSLGWQALVLSIGSILGSILLSSLVYIFVFKKHYEK